MNKSFDEYCDLCDKYENYNYKCDDWVPNKQETDYLMDNLEENYNFVVWILTTATEDIKKEFSAEYLYLQNSFNEVVEFD
mgnify:CR=1 FL=1